MFRYSELFPAAYYRASEYRTEQRPQYIAEASTGEQSDEEMLIQFLIDSTQLLRETKQRVARHHPGLFGV